MIGPVEAQAVLTEVALHREPIVELCADLVAAPSVNPAGDTREVANVVSDALDRRGIPSRLERAFESMPSVVAELDSGRPGPHLVLNVHLDTMPPGDEAAWSVPVWQLTRHEGRLYGLGMGNMKGAVAAMVHAVGILEARRDAWAGRVTFTAVSDEVVFGDHGAAHLLAKYPGLLGDGMICGEGAGFSRLAIGEKGVLWLRISTVGAAGHSSAVRPGSSATARLARAILAVDALTGRRGELGPGIHVADPDGALELTANVGTAEAGTFIGQIATTASAEIDLRLPPGMTAADAEALVRRIVNEHGGSPVLVERIKGWDPNVTDPGSAIVRSWRAGEAAARQPVADLAIRLPASDASRWRALGTPALCFGPQPGLSAGVDDYAEENEVLRCAALYTLAALDFLSPDRAGTDADHHDR